jgi:Domain of unknown function (DUF1844)
MNEEQPTYKVTDRRLFNADGSPREVPAEERPLPTPEPPVIPVEAATPQPEVAAAAPETPPPNQPADSAADQLTDELPDADDPTSFANFIMSIASNAASTLGMMEHPVTGKREVDLELGKHWIDILGMLEKKTKGNLLPQEHQILESLLADLRMQYVSLSNATPAPPRAYSSRDITGG